MLRTLLRQQHPLVSLLSTGVEIASVSGQASGSIREACHYAIAWQTGSAAIFSQRMWGSNSALDVGLKVYKPTTPGMRGRVITDRRDLWKGKPFKALTEGITSSGGRNSQGRTTSFHRGGGHKRLYRIIDFKRDIKDVQGTLERVEYDPNRTARIALVKYPAVGGEGSKERYAYILAPQQMSPGDIIQSGPDAGIKTGNSLPLSAIPVGTALHNVEMHPGRGGQLARSAGTAARLVTKDEKYAVVRLPSGEQRSVLSHCTATVGAVSNPQHKNTKLGKAGASRWLGRRPVVRGMAMNPVDHPHGGGRGKRKGRISQTPWGVPTKGFRTRKTTRTDQYIRLSRHKAS
ncbi:54S ribosomal protein L2 mitochondrial [Trebouxia sp. C0009 RCD-2024]